MSKTPLPHRSVTGMDVELEYALYKSRLRASIIECGSSGATVKIHPADVAKLAYCGYVIKSAEYAMSFAYVNYSDEWKVAFSRIYNFTNSRYGYFR